MADERTTLADLRAAVSDFTDARDWRQFHNGKDLAISITLEAAELLEEYQWHDAAQVAAAAKDPEALERVRQELADILIYCLAFANNQGIDISDAVVAKLELSGRKYPVAAYHGRARKPGWPSAQP